MLSTWLLGCPQQLMAGRKAEVTAGDVEVLREEGERASGAAGAHTWLRAPMCQFRHCLCQWRASHKRCP